eukprot:m51a1_g1010 putative myosin light chain kinase (388) ;mRNA; f:597582-599415
MLATLDTMREPEGELVSISLGEGRGVKTASKDPSVQVFLRFRIDATETAETPSVFADRPSVGEQRTLVVQLVEKGHHTTPLAEAILAEGKIRLQGQGFAGRWIALDKRHGRGEVFLGVRIAPAVPVEQRWTIRRSIGEGSHSVVYLATDKATGESVAIKVINKKKESPQDIKALMREIAIMKKLAHPNIVRLHQVVLTKKTINIVMEHVDGGELFSKICFHGHMAEEDARVVFSQILSAVNYLHSRGVAHRDLKAQNILVSNSLEVKLVDFGLSVDSTVSWMKTMCGSPSYVAPEVFDCMPYTTQCDMWSLGVLLFAMLSGQLPFSSESQLELYQDITQGAYTFDSPVWASVSPLAKDLVAKLLTVDPTRRLTASRCLQHEWLARSL